MDVLAWVSLVLAAVSVAAGAYAAGYWPKIRSWYESRILHMRQGPELDALLAGPPGDRKPEGEPADDEEPPEDEVERARAVGKAEARAEADSRLWGFLYNLEENRKRSERKSLVSNVLFFVGGTLISLAIPLFVKPIY
ncbi:MAG: hypothetical protein ABWY54_04345 [Glaciihabitans sp.]